MALLLALALGSTLATRAAPPDPPCPGDTTQAVDRCLNDRLAAAEQELARYVAAARERLGKETAGASAGVARTPGDFGAAEAAWAAFRKAACGAVYDAWSDGTIRTAMALDCEVRLTRLHTHTVWATWLTYMDSTPPVLPEPQVPPDR